MTQNYPKFSEPETPHSTKLITPLGAATVEVLPDRKAMRRIKKRFREKGECPISAIFTAKQVVEFYRLQGEAITAVVPKEPKPLATQYCPCVEKGSTQCRSGECFHYLGKGKCLYCDNTGTIAHPQPEQQDK